MFHKWWLAKFWTPIVEQLFHSWSIWFWQVFQNWGLNVPQMGGKTVPQWDLTFFLFSDRNNFFLHTLGWLGLTKVMSILTASNPLILALVLSLYHFSKESYRILKLKKKSLFVPLLVVLPYSSQRNDSRTSSSYFLLIIASS